jgi:hypothetical protein
MPSSQHVTTLSSVGGVKRSIPELEDHCRPPGEASYPEHDYPSINVGERCRRCGLAEVEVTS